MSQSEGRGWFDREEPVARPAAEPDWYAEPAADPGRPGDTWFAGADEIAQVWNDQDAVVPEWAAAPDRSWADAPVDPEVPQPYPDGEAADWSATDLPYPQADGPGSGPLAPLIGGGPTYLPDADRIPDLAPAPSEPTFRAQWVDTGPWPKIGLDDEPDRSTAGQVDPADSWPAVSVPMPIADADTGSQPVVPDWDPALWPADDLAGTGPIDLPTGGHAVGGPIDPVDPPVGYFSTEAPPAGYFSTEAPPADRFSTGPLPELLDAASSGPNRPAPMTVAAGGLRPVRAVPPAVAGPQRPNRPGLPPAGGKSVRRHHPAHRGRWAAGAASVAAFSALVISMFVNSNEDDSNTSAATAIQATDSPSPGAPATPTDPVPASRSQVSRAPLTTRPTATAAVPGPRRGTAVVNAPVAAGPAQPTQPAAPVQTVAPAPKPTTKVPAPPAPKPPAPTTPAPAPTTAAPTTPPATPSPAPTTTKPSTG